ncbi:DUF4261 domain-containing protein [Dactylosporangium aurantiacum]|uniref:DUF4261 domain-containing protein n=1 Tax=Dactylosporangium aurantiacum TaxID=35754 RepID=A0A9Q9ILG2_9ACTN|nr:DUF4261 domain-containing protein [Dactylosporangium aurantiacum]MDG6109848.1 DUF4261 domain-containing protein [Dactylosporangium aurantiacum]UWZ57831.1 DUF4261 domain-containing protein [Dactylosporangium aurantiacum]
MSAGLAAQLCYADVVRPRPADVLSGIRRFWPSAELVDGTGRGGGFMVAFPELTTQLGDDAGIRLLVSVGQPAPERGGGAGRDLSQSWEWPDAAQSLSSVRQTVAVTEIFGTSFAPANRVHAVTAVVQGLVAATAPVGVWWPASGLATHPAVLAGRPLGGLVNVRLFNVAGSPGLLAMDTLGLAPLGLPDVECVFSGLPETRMAGYLTSIAEYLVAGHTIRGGDTVEGLAPDQRWRVAARSSSVGPDRPVLSISPGQWGAGAGR